MILNIGEHYYSIQNLSFISYLYFSLEHAVRTEQVEEDSENLWNILQSRVNNVQGQTTSTSSAITLMKQYLNMLKFEL